MVGVLVVCGPVCFELAHSGSAQACMQAMADHMICCCVCHSVPVACACSSLQDSTSMQCGPQGTSLWNCAVGRQLRTVRININMWLNFVRDPDMLYNKAATVPLRKIV